MIDKREERGDLRYSPLSDGVRFVSFYNTRSIDTIAM